MSDPLLLYTDTVYTVHATMLAGTRNACVFLEARPALRGLASSRLMVADRLRRVSRRTIVLTNGFYMKTRYKPNL